MEKNTKETVKGGAHAKGAAKPAHSAASSKGGAHAKGGAQAKPGAHAAKHSGAAAKRKSAKRRGGGIRLSPSDPRFWLIVAAFVVVIALAVVLALTLPGGSKRDDAVPASAIVDEVENLPLATEEVPQDDAAADVPADSDVDASIDAATDISNEEDTSLTDETSTDDASSDDASSGSTANLSPEFAEMMQKYQVLDGIPNTKEPLGLAETARVEDSYFDDALFVGDSVTLKLQRFVAYERKNSNPNLLGGARFLAAQSFSARNALMMVSEKSIHPVIGGVKMTLEDAIASLAPKKLYLMLGMNDVGVSGIEGALENMGKLLQRIKEKNPGMKIIVESATPRLKGTHPNTNQLFAFDVRLYDAIVKMNDPDIEFIDIAYVMRDESGKLIAEYCDDPDNMAIHFTNAGCREWIDYLYTHAAT